MCSLSVLQWSLLKEVFGFVFGFDILKHAQVNAVIMRRDGPVGEGGGVTTR